MLVGVSELFTTVRLREVLVIITGGGDLTVELHPNVVIYFFAACVSDVGVRDQ